MIINRTVYSAGKSILKIDDLINKASKMGASFLGISDIDSMGGIVSFYKKCKQKNIKPIIGVTVETPDYGYLSLIAINNDGLRNIYRFMSTDRSDLRSYRKNVICISGAPHSRLGSSALNKNKEIFSSQIKDLMSIFGSNFYIECFDINTREHKYLNDIYSKLSINKIISSDSRYLNKEDYKTHIVLYADEESKLLPKDWIGYMIPSEFYVKDLNFEGYKNEYIASICNVDLSDQKPKMPNYETNDEYSLLESISLQGLKNLGIYNKTYIDRLSMELDVINNMGFCGYFLVVWDFINFARKNKIPVGPGRGSGAGSLVAYCLRITDIDPIEEDLLFERFLNPERVSMPDFDIDFSPSRRSEVIDYVVEKYGNENVAQIGTFSTLKPKASWTLSSRVLGKKTIEALAVSKRLPDSVEDKRSLSEMFTLDGEPLSSGDSILNMFNDPIMMHHAIKLEGCIKGVGKHAAGIIISPSSIVDHVPAWDLNQHRYSPIDSYEFSNIKYLTQLDKDDVERLGLVKFDFLGLMELDVIDYCIKLAKSSGDMDYGFDIRKIPRDDKKTFDMLRMGLTKGVFQAGSESMSNLIKLIEVSEVEDLVAVNALIRPGPADAGMHILYAKRKTGLEPVEYLHDDMSEVLGSTYGIILYQEQIMSLAQLICGYTLGGADILRRAMGKKKPKEMEMQKDKFIKGGLSKGYDNEMLLELWSQIETFARYGFNRSHSVAYADIMYKTAYLKANYTAAFLAAQMECRKSNLVQVSDFIDDAKRMGCEIVLPNVQVSKAKTYAAKNTIYIGLGGFKNVKDTYIENIVGMAPFDDPLDLVRRTEIDKSTYYSLVYVGAMDCFFKQKNNKEKAAYRNYLIESFNYLKKYSKKNPIEQNSLFSFSNMSEFEIKKSENDDIREMYLKEHEHADRYVTGHPVEDMGNYGFLGHDDFMGYVVLKDWFEFKTKKGDTMAMLYLEDDNGKLAVAIFPDDYTMFKDSLERLKIYFVELSSNDYNGTKRHNIKEIRVE